MGLVEHVDFPVDFLHARRDGGGREPASLDLYVADAPPVTDPVKTEGRCQIPQDMLAADVFVDVRTVIDDKTLQSVLSGFRLTQIESIPDRS